MTSRFWHLPDTCYTQLVTLAFFFISLAVTACVYYPVPLSGRWLVLGLASLIYLLLLSPIGLAVFIVQTLVAYCFACIISSASRWKSVLFTCGATVLILMLVVCRLSSSAESDLATPLYLGISFYSLVLLGYLSDVYRGAVPAERNLGNLITFAGFLPLITSGPIERAKHMFAQFAKPNRFNPIAFRFACELMLWGTFKKIVIANHLGTYVDARFADTSQVTALGLLLTIYVYAYQLYFDFSGYTDIARGAAKVFGIDVLENFHLPYSAVSITDFWRRWHISLSSWFRDYVYIPLGGGRVGTGRKYFHIFIVFILSGLWHGNGTTFLIWGGIHAVLLILENICGTAYTVAGSRLAQAWKISVTFQLVCASWVFFRAPSLEWALNFFERMWFGLVHLLSGHISFASMSTVTNYSGAAMLGIMMIVGLTEIAEHCRRNARFTNVIANAGAWVRWPVYYFMVLAVLIFGSFESYSFIYARF